MLKRKIYNDLIEWKSKKDHLCLLLKGQRQVGKTFIVCQFGMNEYEHFLHIDLTENRDAHAAFSGNLDVDTIMDYLSVITGRNDLVPGSTLIFLDEIQECPGARASLKAFSIDGRYDVIASGSLLGVNQISRSETFIPIGYEEHITLRSLDFEEFLWANGITEEQIDTVKECIRGKKTIPVPYYSKFRDLYRTYMIVGGMPKAVSKYTETRRFQDSDEILENILSSCRMDINRYNTDINSLKTSQCFESIPSQLSKSNKKFMYSKVEGGGSRQSAQKYENNLMWIKGAGYGDFCYSLESPERPLISKIVNDSFRVYMSDTGLLIHMLGNDSKAALYKNDLKYNFGAVLENAVSEAIWKCGYVPYYYRKTNGDNRMELDFVVQIGQDLTFVEVKSGKDRECPSLNKARTLFGPDRSMIFEDDNISIRDGIECYPLFACAFIKEMERPYDFE